ncbi:class I SAM-dependent methyltransferase [Brucella pituitosa]|uniref:class I SAM-dependent methyltransferase n=1 Tax=Brucella pituitosa TaxID=571256 RepID=UPI0009A2426B|nr:class I SAM-dependent methyltransferase [Brucella pituitosa]
MSLNQSILPKVVDYVLQSCGYGNLLELRSGPNSTIPMFVRRGIKAISVQQENTTEYLNGLPSEHKVTTSFLQLPFPDDSFSTVVATGCLEQLDTKDIPLVLSEIYRVSSRYVFLHIGLDSDRTSANSSQRFERSWWETRCFEVGFRKHPYYYQVNPYESLNDDSDELLIILEKVPPNALMHYDLMVLAEERLLHTDMLREAGRRSDAHCIRYHKAAEFIRPGDRVLDVACGLGYGSHILYNNSKAHSVIGIDLSDFSIAYANAHYSHDDHLKFSVGNAQALSEIPSNSIDFIAAFETIEHLPDPHAYLKELKRLLKPSGRLMVCAPNNWVDETGKDPNPFHLHVYTWERLIDECGSYFLLEKGFFQTAGGALRYHHSRRSWVEVSPQKACEQEGEWVLLLCMADPTDSKNAVYEETSWQLPSSPNFNVAAFSRDYENPWLVRGMISIGMRAQSGALLDDMQQKVFLTSKHTTADFGAALCGQIYSQLNAPPLQDSQFSELQEAIFRYAAIPNPTPHQLRWQVSLLFAGGELARLSGKAEAAQTFYRKCTEIDVLPYSPLLGNRTLDALHWLATLAVADNNLEDARAYLEKSVEEAIRLASASWLNVIGDPKGPLPFGFPEMAQIMDKAARAVYMLETLKDCNAKPGLIYRENSGFFERQLLAAKDRIQELETAVNTLVQKVMDGDNHAQDLGRQVINLDKHSQSLANKLVESDDHIQDLLHQIVYLDEHSQALTKKLVESDGRIQAIVQLSGSSVDSTRTIDLVALIAHRITRKISGFFTRTDHD